MCLFCNTRAITSYFIAIFLQWPHLPHIRTSLYHVRGVKVLGPLVPLQLTRSEKHQTLMGAAYWHLKLACSCPFKSQPFLLICLVSSFSDPALICRAILPNPSRFSWSRVPWWLVPRAFSPSCLLVPPGRLALSVLLHGGWVGFASRAQPSGDWEEKGKNNLCF